MKPVINASAVVAYNGKSIYVLKVFWALKCVIHLEWLGGISVKYDIKDKVLQSTKFAFSYTDKQLTIATIMWVKLFVYVY